MMEKIVIGMFGYCGSGQDTLADALCEEFGFRKFSLGDYIRETATSLGRDHTRNSLQDVREYLDAKYGREYVSEEILKRVKEAKESKIVFTGIRRMEEYYKFHDALGMKLLYVYLDEPVRYQRMMKRAEAKDASTIQELKEQQMREEAMFDYDKLKECADAVFDFGIDKYEFESKKLYILKNILRSVWDEKQP